MSRSQDGEQSNAQFAGAIVVQIPVFSEHLNEEVNGGARLSLADGLDGAPVGSHTVFAFQVREIVTQQGVGQRLNGMGRLREAGLGGGGRAGEFHGALRVLQYNERGEEASRLGVGGLGQQYLLQFTHGLGHLALLDQRLGRRNILFLLRREGLVQPLPHGVLGKRTREFIHGAAIHNQFHGRNTPDPELLRQVLVLIRVDLDQLPAARLLGSQFFQHRTQRTTRPAPRGPEVHDDRDGPAALQYVFLKVFQFV